MEDIDWFDSDSIKCSKRDFAALLECCDEELNNEERAFIAEIRLIEEEIRRIESKVEEVIRANNDPANKTFLRKYTLDSNITILSLQERLNSVIEEYYKTQKMSHCSSL